MEIEKGKFYYNKESNKLIIADKDMVVVDNLFTDKIAVHVPTQEDWDFVVGKFSCDYYNHWIVYGSGTFIDLSDGCSSDKDFIVENNHHLITIDQFRALFKEEAPKDEKPSHYSTGIDTFARMEANCSVEECIAFAKGNIDKYNWRNKGQDIEDFDKIISYANWGKKLLSK